MTSALPATPPRIHVLSPQLTAIMAAGEVIDDWGAVVRELIENALDAQAQRIQLHLDVSGQSLEITDNGWGMSWANLQVCCLPHRTSKIPTDQGLPEVQTLGFRGEALHSLAQMGAVTIASRANPQEPGWCVAYNSQGQVEQIETIAMAPGTKITVKHLFQAWPQRQQPPSLRPIQRIIYQAALCHPQVTWQVHNGRRVWFQLSGGQTAQDIILQIFPHLNPGDLQAWITPELELVIGRPDRYHRRCPDWVLLAVNGRCVQLKGDLGQELQQTLLQAWERTLPRHRFPLCFAHLQIPSAQVDWHCHPGKQELYVANPQAWQDILKTALRDLNQITTSPEPATITPSLGIKTSRAAELAGVYGRGVALLNSANPLPSQPELKVLTQVHQTYILVEHPTGLWLVEQHIAHERVLYEQLQANWALVELESPIQLEGLTPPQIEQLTQLWMPPEPFGPSLWLIRQVPKILQDHPDLAAAVWELSLTHQFQAALVATACRSAIRNGTPLGLGEMQTLIDQWQRTEHPQTCPHGRPIYLRLEESSLARFFRRHWVIGKSHGI